MPAQIAVKWNQNRGDQHLLLPAGPHRQPLRGENAFDPLAHRIGARHGETGGRPRCVAGELDQDVGVGRAIGQHFDCRIVADHLGELGQALDLPPGERAEPEQRAIEHRQQQYVEIAMRDVRALVCQNRLAFGVIPLHALARQQDRRAERHRHADDVADAHSVIATACARPIRSNGRGGARQAPGQNKAEAQSQQKDRGHRNVKAGCDGEPIKSRRAGRLLFWNGCGSERLAVADARRASPAVSEARLSRASRRPGANSVFGAASIISTSCSGGAEDGTVTTSQCIIDWHGERRDEDAGPCRHVRARIARAGELQTKPDDRAKQERPQCRFQQQPQHHFFPLFVCDIRSVSMRRRLRSSIAVSTMPTSTSSTDPLQNQSTIRCTARAATRPRASVA